MERSQLDFPLPAKGVPSYHPSHGYSSQNSVGTAHAVHGTPPRTRLVDPVLTEQRVPGMSKRRTWSNVKLVLGEQARESLNIPKVGGESPDALDASDASGTSSASASAFVVARLYATSATHLSIIRNGTIENIELQHVSLPSLAIQNLMNERGPDALISSIPHETVHSELLMDMLLVCHQQSMCLVSKTRDNVDIVLVPRVPTVASRDRICWLVYATNLDAVELCESLRGSKRVAVVLDLDLTLVDAEMCMHDVPDIAVSGSPEEDDLSLLLFGEGMSLKGVEWEEVEVRAWDGRVVRGRRGWPTGVIRSHPDMFYMHYDRYLFRVRIRKGWWELRKFLIDNKARYKPYVCSKGKREYVELIFGGLDASAALIPSEKWPTRITSTWPDTLPLAADKNALMALGCAGPGDRMAAGTHVAAPVICVDDCPQTYSELFRPNVLLVEKFQNGASMGGMCMLRVIEDLHAFWEGTCGQGGTFAWRAGQSFAMAIMEAMRQTLVESPETLSVMQGRCRKQGQLLYRQLTVEYLLPGSTPVAATDSGGRYGRAGRRGHAPKSAGARLGLGWSTSLSTSLSGSRKSLELNNGDGDAVLGALGSRRSLDDTLLSPPDLGGFSTMSQMLSMPTMPMTIPKIPRNGSAAHNNGMSVSGLSPGSVDDDLVTLSLRFKH